MSSSSCTVLAAVALRRSSSTTATGTAQGENKNADLEGRRSLAKTKIQLLGGLTVHGLQTLSTQVHALGAATHHHRAHRNVRVEHAIGVTLGKTDVMTELRTFAAAFTFCHLNHLYTK
jgi:hypothetical protein